MRARLLRGCSADHQSLRREGHREGAGDRGPRGLPAGNVGRAEPPGRRGGAPDSASYFHTEGKGFLVRKTYSTPFWLIVKYRVGGMEVLRTILASGEEALPVFSFEDEARMFLELGTSGCWQVKETTAGELTSILFGPCAGVGRVVLDPLPGPCVEALTGPAGMGRDAFMESHLGVQRPRFVRVRAEHRAPPGPRDRVNGFADEEASLMVERISR